MYSYIFGPFRIYLKQVCKLSPSLDQNPKPIAETGGWHRVGELLAGSLALDALRRRQGVRRGAGGHPPLHGVLHGGEDGVRKVRMK